MTATVQISSEDGAAQTLLEHARKLLKSDEERGFFDALFGVAASEDICRSNAEGLAALAQMGWEEARKHKAGDIQIALLQGSDAQDPESVVALLLPIFQLNDLVK